MRPESTAGRRLDTALGLCNSEPATMESSVVAGAVFPGTLVVSRRRGPPAVRDARH